MRCNAGAVSVWRRLVHAYETVQVELHGAYSVERMLHLDEYMSSCSVGWCVLVMAATPLPCVVVTILADTVPLNPSSEGFASSALFWWRVALVCGCITFAILEQLRYLVPTLPNFTRATIVWMTVVIGIGCSAYGILLASQVGYPLPFTLFFGSPSWQVLFWSCLAAKWGRELFHDHALWHEVVAFYKVVVVQLSLTVVYPTYNHIFTTLNNEAQTLFALLLPVLKLLAKNGFHWVFQQSEDLRPELVIFNVEVFHALFVSTCMQSSRSWSTTAVIMAADALQSWIHIVDINGMLRQLQTLDDKMFPRDPNTLDSSSTRRISPLKMALLYVSLDSSLQTDPSIRILSLAATVAPTPVASTRLVRPRLIMSPSVSPSLSTIHPVLTAEHTRPRLDDPAGVVNKLRRYTQRITGTDLEKVQKAFTTDERREYVGRVLQILHYTEFLVLIEFVEVAVPLIYSIYLTAIYHMPNRVHYSAIAAMDPHTLWSTVATIAGYTALELLSFVVLCVVIQRKLHMSPTRQLVFVLHNQWKLVQSKMILWVLVVVETSLEQFGYDYTFQFAWLHASGVQ